MTDTDRLNDEFWDADNWYRALSLTERLAAGHGAGDSVPVAAAAHSDSARARLEAWKQQPAFEQASRFSQRLALDALSEERLAALLAEPAASLRDRVSTVPCWLARLREAYTEAWVAAGEWIFSGAPASGHPLQDCEPAIRPLLAHGFETIRAGVEALQQRYSSLPFDPEQLPQQVFLDIVHELLFQLSKPVVLEMHIARLLGRLQGETPAERFAHFMRQLSEEGQILPLLAKYPALARLLVTTIEHWAGYVRQFFEHLCADWAEICAVLAPDGEPGTLVEITAGMGDRHRKGRSVLMLRFSSGLRLLYKPKPLAVDVHFQELLIWLNEQGTEPPFRPLKLIDRGAYGWSEFVQATPCASREEVARFYERQGSYLALLYVLNASDLHNENVIAAGEHPMYVDLEALFHPSIDETDPNAPTNLASRLLDQSVWQVGLLPRRLWTDGDSAGVDMSALGGQPGQQLPHALFAWSEQGTDQMQLVRQFVDMPMSQNRPRLGEEDVNVLDYRANILAGFTQMYRLLCAKRAALLGEQLPRFAQDEIRVLLRSTRIYGTLLFESFHPDLLRDGLDRDRYFDRLWCEVKHRPNLVRAIPAERRDLLRDDIPVFTTTPSSRTLFDSDGEPIPDFLAAPSLDLVRHRVQQLGERDLIRQTWIIEASLATLVSGPEVAIEKPLPAAPVPQPVPRERLIALAQAVGQRLEELALQDEQGAYWLGINLLDDQAWSVFPTGPDLYNGNSGFALFLGYLGAITGEPAYTRLAQRVLATVRAQIEELSQDPAEQLVGVFVGLGSAIYLLTHLGQLWRQPALLDEAEQLVKQLPALIERDDSLDIINGSAGLILALLGLHAVHLSSRALQTASLCGEHLLASAQPTPHGIAWVTLKDQTTLGGFSHGTAGITLSLLRLAAATGQDRFRQAALDALDYDRSLFVPELENWADLRVFPHQGGDGADEGGVKTMVAWCHGAPGVGLGRLGALEQLDDAQIREEIEVALRTTIRHGFAGNHSLCHGALGNVELLLSAARVLRRLDLQQALEGAIASVVGSIDANGWVSAAPLAVETPSLMTGLAGIGYQLLRLAEPDRVPCLLLLAPPAGVQ